MKFKWDIFSYFQTLCTLFSRCVNDQFSCLHNFSIKIKKLDILQTGFKCLETYTVHITICVIYFTLQSSWFPFTISYKFFKYHTECKVLFYLILHRLDFCSGPFYYQCINLFMVHSPVRQLLIK